MRRVVCPSYFVWYNRGMVKYIPVLLLIFGFPFLALGANFERDLFFGLRNDPDVTRLQEFLRDQAVYSGPVTGNFFTLTREGMKKFQEREKIIPAAGYFGPKSRARANALLSVAEIPLTAEALTLKIAELQAKLQALQEKRIQEEAAAKAADTTPPIFTKRPQVDSAGFVSDPSLGAHYPYRVTFDWSVDEKGFVDEVVSCSPPFRAAKPAGRLTEYFPEPHSSYSCLVSVKDQAGNETRGTVDFSTPSWVSAAGHATSSFPAVETTPFKIGEFSVYNGTTTDVLFSSFDTLVIDEMDSTSNRGRKVQLLLRDGKNPTDTLISKTDFTIITTPPKIGEPHRSVLKLPFDVKLKPGEEKTISLWVEQLKFVRSGTLEIKSTKTVITDTYSVQGGFDLILTKEPPL